VGGFFIIDRFLKWATLHIWSQPNLVNNYFGWEPFLNPGIAFGLPIPNPLIITLTFPIIILVGMLLFRSFHEQRSALHVFGLVLVFFGAFSNLLDRFFYHYTIDYFLLFRSVFNLADIWIVAGFVLYFLQEKKA
jgi:lipoprotein signal peptidase